MTTSTPDKVAPRRSPAIAFVLALIPGLGQIYVGQRTRGLAVLLTIPSLILLTLWRMSVAGVWFSGIAENAPSDAEVRAALGMGAVMFVLIVLIYAWSIWDAVRTTNGKPLALRALIGLATLAFFIIGWDATEINLKKAVDNSNKLIPYLAQLAWPWDNALVRGIEQSQASVQISTPCTGSAPTIPDEIVGRPYIEVSPMCGDIAGLVQPDGTRNPPGTILHVKGRGFQPGVLATVWWEPPVSSEFRLFVNKAYVTVVPDANGTFQLELNIPNFTIPGGDAGTDLSGVSKLILRQERERDDLHPSDSLMLALSKITETILLGLMATVFGVIFALPVGFLAAHNIMSGNLLTRVVYLVIRLALSILRSIDALIWAIIASAWVGLGPFAGTVALTVHTIGTLGKLYAEAIESIDDGPLEAVRATGANWLQVIIYAVIPQVIPPFVSFTVYRWDVNIRTSTIIGAVGGGGIGLLLIQWIRLLDFDSAGIAVWLIAVVVSILDYVSTEVRKQFV